MNTYIYASPVGSLILKSQDEKITYLGFDGENDAGAGENRENPEPTGVLKECVSQLEKYFSGELVDFNLPLELKGTEFQKRVWDELSAIPYGETRSYKDIASAVNNPKGSRAVGTANHNNPVSIIIPCHRVIAANGALSGYGGGIWRKAWLLEHEKKHI